MLQAQPRVFEEEPLKVGNHLAAIAQDTSVRDDIDRDWLIGEAERSTLMPVTTAPRRFRCGLRTGSAPAQPHRKPRAQRRPPPHRAQAHWHPDAHALLARRKANGDGGLEALRVLKQRLSDIVYQALLTDIHITFHAA